MQMGHGAIDLVQQLDLRWISIKQQFCTAAAVTAARPCSAPWAREAARLGSVCHSAVFRALHCMQSRGMIQSRGQLCACGAAGMLSCVLSLVRITPTLQCSRDMVCAWGTRLGRPVCSWCRYSCSARVTALHTGLLNARRLVRMVTHPVVAVTSNLVWTFSSTSQV